MTKNYKKQKDFYFLLKIYLLFITIIQLPVTYAEEHKKLDSQSCGADVVFLMDNTGSMGPVIQTAQRNATTILNAISGSDPRFSGVDVNYGVATYWGDPNEYANSMRYWFCARDKCPWSWCRRYWCETGGYCKQWGYCTNNDSSVAARKAFKINQKLTGSHELIRKAMSEWRACSNPGGCGGDWAEANLFALHQLATSGGSTDGACIDRLPEGSMCTDRKYGTGYDIGWRNNSARIIAWFGDACSWTTTVDISEAISALAANNVIVSGINTYGLGEGIDHTNTDRSGSCWTSSDLGQATAITAATKGTLTNNVSGTTDTVNAILDAVAGGISQSGSATAFSFNIDPLTTDRLLFQTVFDSKNHSGDLVAYELTANGQIGRKRWSAGKQLKTSSVAKRVMLTLSDTSSGQPDGVPFRWEKLSDKQQDDLRTEPDGSLGLVSTGIARLEYIRGSQSNEESGHNFRSRTELLGDIRQSSAVYVGTPNRQWPDSGTHFPIGSNKYSNFVKEHATRQGTIYVGANDGALHGFRASDGKEIIAYFPGNLFSTKANEGYHRLTDPRTDQRNIYVDGTPAISDAYIRTTIGGPEKWRTLLVGSEGRGGRGLFALDVTKTGTEHFRETNAERIVLWEFDNGHDPHLGFTYSRPVIALLNNGRWAAITGNGIGNTATDQSGGKSQLFIIYLDGGIDGSWTYGRDYLRIETTAGSTTDRNGLFTPAVIDVDSNGTADRVYAGDFAGNLWVFDLSSKNAIDWDTLNKAPLFTAADGQSITVEPKVVNHPSPSTSDPNFLILFGTGHFFSGSDKHTTKTQSFYGVWDVGKNRMTRSHLTSQSFFLNDEGQKARVLDSDLDIGYTNNINKKYGWFIDLPSSRERVIHPAVIHGSLVFFNTIIPDTSVCSSGGGGWHMSVKILNGGSPDSPAFDFDGDGEVKISGDTAQIIRTTGEERQTYAYAGKKVADQKGMPAGPSIFGNQIFVPTSSTKDSNDIVTAILQDNAANQPRGRLSWDQLFSR